MTEEIMHIPFPSDSTEFKKAYCQLLAYVKQKESRETVIAQLVALEKTLLVDMNAALWAKTPTNFEYTVRMFVEYGIDRRFVRLRQRFPNPKKLAIMLFRTIRVAVERMDEPN